MTSIRIWFLLFSLAMAIHRTYFYPQYDNLSAFERGWAICLKETEWLNRKIASYLRRNEATVRWCWQESVNLGWMQYQKRNSRPTEATKHEDWAIVRSAVTAPNQPVHLQWCWVSSTWISLNGLEWLPAINESTWPVKTL